MPDDEVSVPTTAIALTVSRACSIDVSMPVTPCAVLLAGRTTRRIDAPLMTANAVDIAMD